jgi:hypothetical protein
VATGRRLVLRTLGDQSLGGEHEAGDAGRVLQRVAHDLGRVDHALREQGAVSLDAGVGRDLTERLLDGAADDVDADALLGRDVELLEHRLRADERDAAARHDAFLDLTTEGLDAPLISAFLPAPSTIVVLSLSIVMRLAVPRSVMVMLSSLMPRSSLTTEPPVSTAMSFRISLRRSPKPVQPFGLRHAQEGIAEGVSCCTARGEASLFRLYASHTLRASSQVDCPSSQRPTVHPLRATPRGR